MRERQLVVVRRPRVLRQASRLFLSSASPGCVPCLRFRAVGRRVSAVYLIAHPRQRPNRRPLYGAGASRGREFSPKATPILAVTPSARAIAAAANSTSPNHVGVTQKILLLLRALRRACCLPVPGLRDRPLRL